MLEGGADPNSTDALGTHVLTLAALQSDRWLALSHAQKWRHLSEGRCSSRLPAWDWTGRSCAAHAPRLRPWHPRGGA